MKERYTRRYLPTLLLLLELALWGYFGLLPFKSNNMEKISISDMVVLVLDMMYCSWMLALVLMPSITCTGEYTRKACGPLIAAYSLALAPAYIRMKRGGDFERFTHGEYLMNCVSSWRFRVFMGWMVYAHVYGFSTHPAGNYPACMFLRPFRLNIQPKTAPLPPAYV